MKISILSFLIFYRIFSFAQDGLIKVNKSFLKYYTDTICYSQLNIEIINNTYDNYIIWFDSDSVSNLPSELKVKKYFQTIKGDFSLSQLISENEIIRLGSSVLFVTFYKIIKPKNNFQITILKSGEIKNENAFLNSINKHFVIIKENETKRLPDINNLEVENYKGNNITILSDLFKL